MPSTGSPHAGDLFCFRDSAGNNGVGIGSLDTDNKTVGNIDTFADLSPLHEWGKDLLEAARFCGLTMGGHCWHHVR